MSLNFQLINYMKKTHQKMQHKLRKNKTSFQFLDLLNDRTAFNSNTRLKYCNTTLAVAS